MGKNPAAETSPVKDGVVCDYLAGVKTVVIQDRYKIPRGVCIASGIVPMLD